MPLVTELVEQSCYNLIEMTLTSTQHLKRMLQKLTGISENIYRTLHISNKSINLTQLLIRVEFFLDAHQNALQT